VPTALDNGQRSAAHAARGGRAAGHDRASRWLKRSSRPSATLISLSPLDEHFASILAAAKAGDERAITALYRALQPSLLRYLRAQAPVEAEDLASEVWADAASGLSRFDGNEQGFRRWLFTIARRRLIDLRRRASRRPVTWRPLADVLEACDAADPELQVLVATETEAAIARIGELPPDQAEVVLLRVLGGLDVESVAAILGKKPGAVRVLQHRALTRLAEQLTHERQRGVTQ
jgi:RNA polymerase sigma-70 factor, ECF subfamily